MIMAAVLNNLSPDNNQRPQHHLYCNNLYCGLNYYLETIGLAWTNFVHNSCIIVLPGLFTQLVAVVTNRIIITPAKVIIITSTLIIFAVQNWKKLVLGASTNTGTESRHWPTVQIGLCSVLLKYYFIIGAHQSWTGPAMSSDSSSRLSVRTPMFQFGCIISQSHKRPQWYAPQFENTAIVASTLQI